MKDRWSAQLAACLLVVHLSGCNILLFPLTLVKGLLGTLIGLLKFLGPAAGAAGALALVNAEPDEATRAETHARAAMVEQQLVEMYRHPEDAVAETLTPTQLADLARRRGAVGVTMIDLSALSEDEARAALDRLAARGEVLLLDGSTLTNPEARARLDAALRAANVALVDTR